MTKHDDLIQFATQRELDYIEAIRKHGSNNKAAKALGVGRRGVDQAITRLAARAAARGHSPKHDMTHVVPEGFKVRGVSTLYDKAGKQSAQWVKSSIDADQQLELLKEFALSLGEGVKGLAKIVKAPRASNEDLMVVIPMGDPHFGMAASAQDAGGDFSLEHAERLTKAAIDRLVSSGPDAAVALLLNLGDMFHADNQKNQSQSGHQLDVDGRWASIQKVGLMSMIYCVTRLLEKYPLVIFKVNRGNHDGHSSYALALMLSCYFHNEPRVKIDLSQATAWYFQFGKVLLGSTHGDTIKGKDMLSIMAADMPKEWGTSLFRHWLVGHVHHHDAKEYHGGIVEYFRTLATRDAWHQGQGYRAGRDMCLIVYHKEFGEIERHRCDIGMIDA